MAFTTIAYSESQDTGGVLTNVAALADQHVRVEGDRVIVPRGMNNLLGAMAVGATITLARLQSPALRRTVLPDLGPINVGAEPLSPTPFFNAFYNPLPLDEDEGLEALVAEEAEEGEQETVVVWLGDGPQSPISGEIYTVRGTAEAPAGAYAWGNAALTFDQTLPAGRYQVVGMRAMSSSLIAARLVFVGGMWRPGVIGYDSVADIEHDIFRRGNLGVFGEFEHNQPPTVDFLSVNGGESSVVFLDLIKIA